MKILPIVKLQPKYARFCLFETIAINGVGCGTLIFQDQLRNTCPYPGLYEFWFHPPIPTTESEYLMTYMIAAWLATAGVLQAFINFDDEVPKRTKQIALYSFALCDVSWIVLMIKYTFLFSLYHIFGSCYTILQRFYFLCNQDELFSEGNVTIIPL